MPRNKANNQYFAEALETRIWEKLSNSDYGGTVLYAFLKEELDELDTHAELIANRIKEDFSEINSIEYVGRYTGSESGDFIINGETIELKSVSTGSGTYYNTSMNYLNKLGCESYHSFLSEKGYIAFLQEQFPDKVNINALSPVSIKNSSIIRHQFPKVYEDIKVKEELLRVKYVSYLYDFLLKNPDKCSEFCYDMIHKGSNTSKSIPDRTYIHNYKTNKINVLTFKDIESLTNCSGIRNAGLSIVIGETFRVAIGWQNGNGLSNPTLRVFIKGGKDG